MFADDFPAGCFDESVLLDLSDPSRPFVAASYDSPPWFTGFLRLGRVAVRLGVPQAPFPDIDIYVRWADQTLTFPDPIAPPPSPGAVPGRS